MPDPTQWLYDLSSGQIESAVTGLVLVNGYLNENRPPEEVAIMEKAAVYGAHSVFFQIIGDGQNPVPQALVFVSDDPILAPEFGELHRRLWAWGAVPLVYRKTHGLVQLFRCAHKPDFISESGEIKCNPIETLTIGAEISKDPWWNSARLSNGTLWDDSKVCKRMLSPDKAAHKALINYVHALNKSLVEQDRLPRHLQRKLLILALLIAYLEERGVFTSDFFSTFKPGAIKFFEVLSDARSLIPLLAHLEERFNGNVFALSGSDSQALIDNPSLGNFARFIEARTQSNWQMTLWELYSFKDLPVEVISHIYQLFVEDANSSIYTPPFLVRLMLEEALSWSRIDRLHEKDEIVLDPSCGSGVFLVEAYKRIVLHWRSQNGWKRPEIAVLQTLLQRVHGIDMDSGAVELAAFSLCLALCDALEPEEIRSSIKLFPPLQGTTLHHSCFFKAKNDGAIEKPVGVIVGNPPFKSVLDTDGAKDSYEKYQLEFGPSFGRLPDKQLAYLFLHEAMGMLADGGILSMLQQYSFLYNEKAGGFRKKIFETWNVREILDFVSVRGLFTADTKVVVIVAESAKPRTDQRILHATFRRSGRTIAEQGFEIDYYDLHWMSRELALDSHTVWRSNLLGGGRVLDFVNRLKEMRTLSQFADIRGWVNGEGFIEGQQNISKPADHIVGKPLLPSEALTLDGIDTTAITIAPKKPIEGPRTEGLFTSPLLLIREQMDIPHALWTAGYLTFKCKIVGFAAPETDLSLLIKVDSWLSIHSTALRAFLSCISIRLFTQKATTLSGLDIKLIPYPISGNLDISSDEDTIAEDIVDYYRDLVRLGQDSEAMKEVDNQGMDAFVEKFTNRINAVYNKNPVRALVRQSWPGIICQPFVFGEGEVDWSGADELQDKLGALLWEECGKELSVTRVTRLYDGRFIFLVKPDRQRYWLRSIALRDGDEIIADLRTQGF